jgi:zinc transport system substrate-binding protein
MKKYRIRIISLASLFLFIFLFSCKSGKNDAAGITVTIEPVKYFVDRLTSGTVDVNVMVPKGANPATYSPTTSQLMKLSSSGLYIQTGFLGFEEAWMGRLKELNPSMHVFNLSEYANLIKGGNHAHGDHLHKEGVDPHLWMSPSVVLEFLSKLKEQLVKTFPDKKLQIEKNYPVFRDEIRALDNAFSELSGELKQKKFMIFHPALTYLARDYELEQISIEYEGKEPSPQKLRDLIDMANVEDIRIIFIQAEFDQHNAEMVSDATSAQLIRINPLAYDWLNSMRQILELLRVHLK